jgi:hypothetical protein
MTESNKNTFLRLILIGWKLGFFVLLGFLAYSIYNKIIGAIIFCVVFLIFTGYLIKKYSKKV